MMRFLKVWSVLTRSDKSPLPRKDQNNQKLVLRDIFRSKLVYFSVSLKKSRIQSNVHDKPEKLVESPIFIHFCSALAKPNPNLKKNKSLKNL